MNDWIVSLVRAGGYGAIGLLMLLENIVPPIPSELIMPLAGYLTVDGRLSLWVVIAVGALGSVLGNVAWYLLGRRVPEARIRAWVRRHGRWVTLGERDLDHARRWFAGHGRWAVALGRVMPGVRTLISLPAGFARMPAAAFVGFTALGTLAWTAALAVAGRVLADNYDGAGHLIGIASWAVLGVMVAVYVWRVVRWQAS